MAAARIIACCISSATSASFDARERAGVRLCITAPTEGADPERRKAGGEARRSVEEYTLRRARRGWRESDDCRQVQVAAETIVVGHSLENDLRALKLVHTNVRSPVTLLARVPRGPEYS